MKSHSSYRPSPELEDLVSRAADNLLSPEEDENLASLLRDDVAAQRFYLNYMGLSASLEWNYAEAAATPEATVSNPESEEKESWLWPLRIAAILCILLSLYFSARPDNLVSVEIADGAFYRGNEVVALKPGDSFPQGYFFIESSSGSAQLRFDDGTLVTLGGGCEVSINESTRGKRLELRAGVLSAVVSPQPEGKPLRIGTVTAELEVLGTVLTVEVNQEETGLSVTEGAVRFKRLADGDSIEVPALHNLVASLDTREALQPEPVANPDGLWQLDLQKPNARVTKGLLVAGQQQGPRYVAEPAILGRYKDGQKIIRNSVAINGRLAKLNEASTLRVRYRAEKGPLLFLSLAKENGRFGGNFEVDLNSDDHPPEPDGWSEAVVPMSSFNVVDAMKERGFRLNGSIVQKVLISVHGSEPLEVAEVEFLTQPSKP